MNFDVESRRMEAGLPEFSKPVYGGNVLRELSVGGQNVILPWGVEFADSSAFYSLEEGVGYRYDLLEHQESFEHLSHTIHQVIQMREGLVRLKLRELLDGPRELRRTCTLTCLEDTTLMDFVLRYRFSASEFPKGYIAGRVLPFVGSCVYHQYAVDSAAIGNDEYSIRIQITGKKVPTCMLGHTYLRDSENAWVLHIRMLPIKWDKEVVKLCSRWFGTRPLPQWANMTMLQIPWVKAALWYRGEQRPWGNRFACIFSPNAYPMARLAKGEVLRWDAVCRIEPPLEEKPDPSPEKKIPQNFKC
jgi:hypothetical protein